MKGDEDTWKKLEKKHPAPHPDTAFPSPPDDPTYFVCAKEDIQLAIKSFRNGAGGGHDGLLPQHLKDMISDQLGGAATTLLNTLTDFLNTIVFRGQVPTDICPTFFGAHLIALSKPDGGVRPITIRLTLGRLAGKVAMAKLKDTCKTLFQPHQLGDGIAKGGEIAVHSLRKYVKSEDNKDKIALKIDYRNAFNTLRRDVILSKVKQYVPMLFPLANQSYSAPSNLYFNGSRVLPSREGIQQGDPIGPYLFSLGILELMKSCASELNVFYLDDGTLAGPPDVVKSDFAKIIEESRALGLEVNDEKCEIYFPDESHPDKQRIMGEFKALAPKIKLVTDETLTLLGAPIHAAAIDGVLTEKLDHLSLMAERLESLDSHDALFLLKNCFALPKLMYFLRSAPCFKSDMLKSYDERLRKCLETILNVELDGDAWTQCSLPVSQGGLGVRKATDLALPAFLASANGAMNGMSKLLSRDLHEEEDLFLTEAETLWKGALAMDSNNNSNNSDNNNNNNNNNDNNNTNNNNTNNNNTEAAELSEETSVPANPAIQTDWDNPLYTKIYKDLLGKQSSPVEKARLLAVASEHSSDWLNAIPVSALGLKLDNNSIRLAVGLRLGSKICQPHTCTCGNLVDKTGRHGLSCQNAKGTNSRHHHINDLIRRALISANIPAVCEPPGLHRSDQRRVDGMTTFPWSAGKSLVWDFTCRDTLAMSYVGATSREAGKAAELAEKRKATHYQDLAAQYIVTPVAMETLGSWGPESIKFIKDLGGRIAQISGEPRSTSYLFQSLGMAAQRGNAVSIAGTVPSAKKLDEIFYL